MAGRRRRLRFPPRTGKFLGLVPVGCRNGRPGDRINSVGSEGTETVIRVGLDGSTRTSPWSTS